LQGRLEPTRVELITVFCSYGRLLPLASSIKLWWKGIALAYTIAYCDMASFTAMKSFIIKAPSFISKIVSANDINTLHHLP
jgi:hypothetical protein